MKRLVAFAGITYVAVLVLTISERQVSGAKPLDGQQIFRFDTFRDEQLWTDVLRMHEVLPTLTPEIALGAGLKVDSEALPPPVVAAITAKKLPLDDPRVTLRLLEMNAVVGLVGKVVDDKLKSVGITCALCHSTVDDSLGTGIGKRLDGWPNRQLNVGLIVSLSPSELIDPFRQEFALWGPGKYDARHHIFDGTNLTAAARPDPVRAGNNSGRHPSRVWTAGCRVRDLHWRRPDLLLEQLCWRDADGRTGKLQRPAHRCRGHSEARSGHPEAGGAVGLSAESACASTASEQLQQGCSDAGSDGIHASRAAERATLHRPTPTS